MNGFALDAHLEGSRRAALERRRERQELADSARELFEAGESAEEILRRFGLRPGTLSKRLQRHGEFELARPFERIAQRQRRARARSAC